MAGVVSRVQQGRELCGSITSPLCSAAATFNKQYCYTFLPNITLQREESEDVHIISFDSCQSSASSDQNQYYGVFS